MAMEKCPFYTEEIQAEAVDRRFYGGPLDKKTPVKSQNLLLMDANLNRKARDMRNIAVGMILMMVVIGCESTLKQERKIYKNSERPKLYETRKGVFGNHLFSTDPLVEKTYVDCINNLQEVCRPALGMTFRQLKELRTLESSRFKGKLDWRDSDGSEQWSEKFKYHKFIRIYTFNNGRLTDWTDMYYSEEGF